MTRAGVILGTAPYMSPEQAKGRAVDKRVDIWAFGCVLFEMLTGRRAFAGEDVTDTLTAVMRDQPDWSRLPPGTPRALQQLLSRCLEKNTSTRLRDIGEARVLLTDRAGRESEIAPSASPSRTGVRRLTLVTAAGVIVGAILGMAVLAWWRPSVVPAKPVVRFSIAIPPSTPLLRSAGGGLTFSPDGQTLVYVVRPEGQSRAELRLRRLDAEHDMPVRGTEGGFAPFFSPDGQWLGFFADQKLKKVAIAGGPPTTICEQGRFSRAVWTADHAILLGTTQAVGSGGLARVPDSGGVPVDFTTPVSERERFHQSPQLLPDGRHFLLTIVGPAGSQIGWGSLGTGAHHALFEGTFATWLPPDRILFAKGTELFAVPFDVGTLAVTGAAERVLDVATTMIFGGVISMPLVAIDREGSIAYTPALHGAEGTLVRIDGNERLTAIPIASAAYNSPRLSPDGSRVALSIADERGRPDIWIIDVARGTRLRLTTEGGQFPAWSPDGRAVTFAAIGAPETERGAGLLRVPADGSGTVSAVTDSRLRQQPSTLSLDGKILVFAQLMDVRGRFQSDLYQLTEGGAPVAILATPADERSPALAPDGRWVAYVSNSTGRDEVYIKNLSPGGATLPVSNSGGFQPVWARDGRSLFYREADRLMRSTFDGSSARLGNSAFAMALSRATFGNSPDAADYDVGPDGSLTLIRRDTVATGEDVKVILNWSRTLSRSAQ
jgi:Tol biopolymer transport system component